MKDIDYERYMKINERRFYDKEYYAFDSIPDGGNIKKS